jgi:pimeloyl-ACP methyl ester carboxylesterase
MDKAKGWRRVGRWALRGGLGLLGLLGVVIAAGATYEALGRRAAVHDYPAQGRMVDIGGRRIHLDCRGSGSPTVVFESGLGSGGSLDWSLVHDQIAKTTRACAYDRAGIVWSDPKTTPQDGDAVARDLHAALAVAHVDGPLVLVGHSIGGPYITSYTGLYGGQVAGLVFVDGSRPDQVARLNAVTGSNTHPGQMARTMHIGQALRWTGLVRWLTSGRESPRLPARANAEIAAYGPASMSGMAAELDGFDRTMASAARVRSFGDRPMVVLTAMKPLAPRELKMLKLTPEQGARMKQTWRALHTEQLAMSRHSRQQIVPDSGHYIQIERPDVVVDAVDEVVAAVRQKGSPQTP